MMVLLQTFLGTVIGGIVIYEYSRWRTIKIAKKLGLLRLVPKKGELLKVVGAKDQ